MVAKGYTKTYGRDYVILAPTAIVIRGQLWMQIVTILHEFPSDCTK